MKYIILDIDNCISNDAWRVPRIAWHHKDNFLRYKDYHMLAPFDSLHNQHLYESAERAGHGIIIFTSRPVFYKAITEEWLRLAKVQWTHLIMRNDKDYRSAIEVKAEHVKWLSEYYDIHLNDIVIAYDDRPEIVAMYQAHGLTAEVVAIHTQVMYKEPMK